MLVIEKGLQIINFDKVSFTKTLDRVMGQIIREAARTWLRAVLTSVPQRGGFPVLTGAAKSTLAPLGRILRVAVPVTPVARSGRSTVVDRRDEGEAAQYFDIKSSGFTYEFSWSNDLLHYYLNETFPMLQVKYTPWKSVKKGEAAMKAYVKATLLSRLPNIAKYIKFKDI